MGRREALDIKRKKESGSVFIRLPVSVTESCCCTGSSEGNLRQARTPLHLNHKLEEGRAMGKEKRFKKVKGSRWDAGYVSISRLAAAETNAAPNPACVYSSETETALLWAVLQDVSAIWLPSAGTAQL